MSEEKTKGVFVTIAGRIGPDGRKYVDYQAHEEALFDAVSQARADGIREALGMIDNCILQIQQTAPQHRKSMEMLGKIITEHVQTLLAEG